MMRSSACMLAIVALGCGDRDPASTATTTAAPAPTKPAAQPAQTGDVTIAGSVIDQSSGHSVAGVDVVLRPESSDLAARTSEQTARTNAAGEFSIRAVAGTYRAYVRGEDVLSIGLADRVRLDAGPRRELAGKPDESLMPLLEARSDLTGVELTVVGAAVLTGVVLDPERRAVAGALIRVVPADRFSRRVPTVRPVLGTDAAISDASGTFTLRVPPGEYVLDATHATHAGVRGTELSLRGGQRVSTEIGLARGCIVAGRVVRADGSPSPDGAIERVMARSGRAGFGPASRIDAGEFRFITTDEETVMLRAWPWRSPPSAAKTFACADGKRFDDVVLRLPDREPDISGVIVDARDRPVPLVHLDIQPLDPIVGGQQERADAAGVWHVYDMPAARYRVTASAPGAGVVDTVVVAPRHDLRLALGGTGRIVGTTTELVTGSVHVSFLSCGSADDALEIAHEPRIVPVVSGRFVIERAPACTLSLALRWRDRLVEHSVVVEPDRTAYVEVDVGTPRDKRVSGVVRDDNGTAIGDARVTAVIRDREAATARTDSNGRFTLQTHAGAQLVAGKNGRIGRANVGRANVRAEQVDIVLDDAAQ
jgi:hypothetical protein